MSIHDAHLFSQKVISTNQKLEQANKAVEEYSHTLEVRVKNRIPRLEETRNLLQESLERRTVELKESEGFQKKLRTLNQRMETVRDDERAKIAREIHDELGQKLTALKFDLFWLRNELPKSNFPLKRKIRSMEKSVETIINSVSEIASSLQTEVLGLYGLSKGLENLIDEFQKHSKIKCKFFNKMEGNSLGHEKELTVYRIFQESLTNVSRHSKAKNVIIVIERDETHFYLGIQDDGIGVEKDCIDSPKSTGLMGMKERAKQCGGSIEFQSIRNKGARIVLQIPLDDDGKGQ